MNGGDPVVGGNQVTPGGTRPVIPGPQPATPAAAPQSFSTNSNIPQGSPVPSPAAPTATVPTISNTPITSDADFSSLHSGPTPSPTPPSNPLVGAPVAPQPTSPPGAGMPAPMSGTPMQNTFSQTPLAQNGFTQNPFSGGVYNPNVYGQGEDIVIGGSTGTKPPKSKAKVILAVLAILIVLAGVAWAVVSSFGGLIGGGGSTANDTKTLLNTYSNYLLFGTESSNQISDDVSWSTETIDSNLTNTNEEAKTTYFNTLINLYSNFSTSYSDNTQFKESLDENNGILLGNLVSDTTTALETLQIYSSIPSFTTDDMISYYLSKGGDNLSSYSDSIYGPHFGSSNSAIDDYASTKATTASLVVELYDKYRSLGCISNQKVIQECVDNARSDESVVSGENQLLSYSRLSSSKEKHIVKDPVSSSRMIYEIFYPKEEASD